MAVGTAKVLGVDLINNFERPYFATGITNFWRRWHISLSFWLRDYVYIPLGGSRCSKIRNYWNIFITFFVSGLWHGANWTFIIWGLIHGIAQIIEKATGLRNHKFSGLSKQVYILFTFAVVTIAWIFFRMPSVHDAGSFIYQIATWRPSIASFDTLKECIIPVGMILILAFKDIRDEYFPTRLRLFENKYIVIRWASYLFILFLILGFGVLGAGQFIYANF